MSECEFITMQYPVMCYRKTTTPGVQTEDSVPFHRHDGYEFYLFLDGSVNSYIGDSVFSPVRGDLIIMNPEQAHRAISLGPQTYERFIINLRKDKMDKFMGDGSELSESFEFSDPAAVKKIRLGAERIEEYCAVAEKLSTAVYLRKPCDDLLVDAYLTELLVLISRELEGNRGQDDSENMPELVREVKDYIFRHLTEQITLDDLSAQFFFNGKYISAMFKRYTGMTLRSYILEQRLCLAKRLLREGSNVSEACYHSGFLDYTNFIRSFTRSVGMSPGKYSRCAKAGALR